MAKLLKDCTLVTQDKVGSDLIIKEYPGRITSEQVRRTRRGKNVLYEFSGLNPETVEDFLSRYPPFNHLIIEHGN